MTFIPSMERYTISADVGLIAERIHPDGSLRSYSGICYRIYEYHYAEKSTEVGYIFETYPDSDTWIIIDTHGDYITERNEKWAAVLYLYSRYKTKAVIMPTLDNIPIDTIIIS